MALPAEAVLPCDTGLGSRGSDSGNVSSQQSQSCLQWLPGGCSITPESTLTQHLRPSTAQRLLPQGQLTLNFPLGRWSKDDQTDHMIWIHEISWTIFNRDVFKCLLKSHSKPNYFPKLNQSPS